MHNYKEKAPIQLKNSQKIDNIVSLNQLKISVISDTHLIPTEMIAYNDKYFTHLNKDRKLLEESQALFNAALKEVKDNQSHLLLIAGDLTKDGELESHIYIANKLKQFKSDNPQVEIVLVPGNHDINNHQATNFSKNASATITSPNGFINVYHNIVSNTSIELFRDSDEYLSYLKTVNSKYNRLPINEYYAHGYTSYVKRIKMPDQTNNGDLTVIALDTCRYSVDATSQEKDNYQETAGHVTAALMLWLVNQASKARNRDDVIVLVAHHGFIPHLYKQDIYFKEYLISNWNTPFHHQDPRIDGKTPAQILADSGIHFMFSGHMHAQDIAQYTSPLGNKLYDIETGSIVSYPNPLRHLLLTKYATKSGPLLALNIKSLRLKTLNYYKTNKQFVFIEDLQKHSASNIVNEKLLVGIARHYLNATDKRKLTIDSILKRIFGTKNQTTILVNYITENVEQYLINAHDINTLYNIIKYSYRFEYHKTSNNKIYFDIDLSVLGEYQFSLSRPQFKELIQDLINQFNGRILQNPKVLDELIEDIARTVLELEIITTEQGDQYTLLDLVQYVYKTHLAGDERQAKWVKLAIINLKEPDKIIENLKLILETISIKLYDLLSLLKLDLNDYLDVEIVSHGNDFVWKILSNILGNNAKRILSNMGVTQEYFTNLITLILLGNKPFQFFIEHINTSLIEMIESLTNENIPGYEAFRYTEDNHTSLIVKTFHKDINVLETYSQST